MNAWTIPNLLRMYRSGRLSPREVCKEIVEESQRLRDWNIWIQLPSMTTIEPYLEQLNRDEMNSKPLWGVPFAVKDNIDIADMPTTAACPNFAYTAEQHARVVALLVENGAIPIGKTNLDQFATGLVGIRSPYGETHNAWQSALISGGSSSGSAVAVGMGLVPFALGTDTAGSGRVPAALNGVVGYKPPIGAWSTSGVVPACKSLDCVSVFTRSLYDAQLIDRLLCEQPLGFTQVRPTVVLVPREPLDWFGPYASAFQQAWERTVDAVAAQGFVVREIDLAPFDEATNMPYDGPWIAERWASIGNFVTRHPDGIWPVTKEILSSGQKALASEVFRAIHRLEELRRWVRDVVNESAILMMPTVGGTYSRDVVREDPIAKNRELGRYTHHCNLLDLAAIAVPAGQVEDGIPFGVTLFVPGERAEVLVQTASSMLSINMNDDCCYGREDKVAVAVCGQHMRGLALNYQLEDLQAKYCGSVYTAPRYRLYALNTEPVRPGLVRQETDGVPIEMELWEMSVAGLGALTASVRYPLAMGSIELADGRLVTGFTCVSGQIPDAIDISYCGGFRRWLELKGNTSAKDNIEV
ncbi:allophanate hydrolase [Alicyclobacillus hesperidum]|uniref:Allophanate hydrolase n=1 Tax=Alicyclobacillus hesperidum TaxID=89784 RepID=A0A1H2XE85_9BACL|nr:allophanate hydrolase [Alicyclobacillus hesperidum]SDW91223.1 allophanate hydrolase [Alicyclobacillus hesperidum]